MSLFPIPHNKFFIYFLILGAASCTPKSKTEQPVAKADSAKSIVKSNPVKVPDTQESKPEENKSPSTIPKKTVEKPLAKAEVKTEPVKEKVVEPVKETVAVIAPVKEPVIETPHAKEPEKIIPPKIDSSSIKKPEGKPKGKPYYFKVVRKEDGKEIFGNLQLQEAVSASQFLLVKSGQVIYLEEPNNRRGTYNIVALLPGYKQSSLVFGYNNPAIEKGPNNEDVITLTLVKARAGDYIDFNNVHFFKNTSVMRPVSQAELDELVNLLKEDLKYKIKIYGYCNGTQDRESYTMGTSTNFFAMDPKTNKKETISSKELSMARAENVKAYLVKQGVDASRVSTKGEGGKVPLYLESGTLSQYNDRIEIEFVKN